MPFFLLENLDALEVFEFFEFFEYNVPFPVFDLFFDFCSPRTLRNMAAVISVSSPSSDLKC